MALTGNPQIQAQQLDFSGSISAEDMSILLAQDDDPDAAELYLDLTARFNALGEEAQFAKITAARALIEAKRPKP